MSERNSPASQSNPNWLMGEADLLRFERQRVGFGSAQRQLGTRGRARMPAPSGSGYEQILAARGELRTRADRAVADARPVADARRPSAKPAAAPTAPAATWSLEQLPRRPHHFNRRDRPALIVWASLTAPAACVLVAFAWAGGPPRSPALPTAAPESSRASLRVANAGFVAPLPSASEGDPLFAARASQPRTAPDDAEPVVPHEDMWLRPKPNDAEAEPVFAAPAGGSEPETAEADSGPAQESASSDAVPGSPDMLPEEVQAAFATWDRSTSASAAEGGPEAGSAEGGPVLAARDRDAAVAGTASDSGTPEDGRTPSTTTGAAMDAEATRDDPAEGGAAMAVAPDHAPPAVPTTVDATETAALEEAREVSASAEPGERDAALATEPSPPLEEKHQASATRPTLAGQTPEAARPSAGTDAAVGSEASSEPPTAASPPSRMAGLVASPPAPPTPAALPSTKPRLDGASQPPVSRSAAAGGGPAASAPPSPDPRCRAIVVRAQLGEETSHAERLLLRSGCGARR